VTALVADARAWCAGRYWQWRLPLLGLLGWNGLRQLRDPDGAGLFSGITFGAHEFGHLLFAAFGQFLAVAGGSLTQLLVPLGALLLLWHQRDYFGVAVGGTWLASSLIDLARYMADARAGELDLVSFGEDAIQDWTWLFGRMHLLAYDTSIAGGVRLFGFLLLLAALGLGAWLCMNMRSVGTEAAPS